MSGRGGCSPRRRLQDPGGREGLGLGLRPAPEDLRDGHRADRRTGFQEERRGRPICPVGADPALRRVRHALPRARKAHGRQLQGDPAHPNEAGTKRRVRGGQLPRRCLPRKSGVHLGGNGRPVCAASPGQFDGQLRQGHAARAGQDRPHAGPGCRPPAAARTGTAKAGYHDHGDSRGDHRAHRHVHRQCGAQRHERQPGGHA